METLWTTGTLKPEKQRKEFKAKGEPAPCHGSKGDFEGW